MPMTMTLTSSEIANMLKAISIALNEGLDKKTETELAELAAKLKALKE